MIDPKTFYTEKIAFFSAQVSSLQKQLTHLGILRLAFFLITRQQDPTHSYRQVWIQ